jgi:hypothetical protein
LSKVCEITRPFDAVSKIATPKFLQAVQPRARTKELEISWPDPYLEMMRVLKEEIARAIVEMPLSLMKPNPKH